MNLLKLLHIWEFYLINLLIRKLLKTWYEFFLDIPEKILKESIKDLAKEKKYLPSLQELLEKCRSTFNQRNHQILDLMYKKDILEKDYMEN